MVTLRAVGGGSAAVCGHSLQRELGLGIHNRKQHVVFPSYEPYGGSCWQAGDIRTTLAPCSANSQIRGMQCSCRVRSPHPWTSNNCSSFLDAMDGVAEFSERTAGQDSRFRWVWVVALGVLAISAGVGMVVCRQQGYAGFNGNIEFVRNAEGVKVGIKAGCYN